MTPNSWRSSMGTGSCEITSVAGASAFTGTSPGGGSVDDGEGR